jgi:putative ATP-dependent endonuclease of the OLD family
MEEEEDSEKKLAPGLKPFIRDHKRICGFVFLRALRTGSRALSLQRGSLLDTILRLGGSGFEKMWQDTIKRLRELVPPIGEIGQLKTIQSEIRQRMASFINLAQDGNSTAFFPSDLTREHVREVVRLFVATDQNDYLVPFPRLGTGTINMLVFALLTFIAELKNKRKVIFAMEEPEIALPPHTQRRVARFVLREMGQAIVTSHSPYIIEQFEPEQIVTLNRKKAGILSGRPIDLRGIKPKTFKVERRQFAEAILSNAVLVVEGATEAALFPVASTVLEKSLGADIYTHLDLAGVSIFDAGGDGSVPRYGPIFKSLGKRAFAFYDKPNAPFVSAAVAQLGDYAKSWESPHKDIEDVLVEEMKSGTMRRFLDEVKARLDYPQDLGKPSPGMTDDEAKDLTKSVLEKRKGGAYGYAALLIGQCESADELPLTIRAILEAIHQLLFPPAETVESRRDPQGDVTSEVSRNDPKAGGSG